MMQGQALGQNDHLEITISEAPNRNRKKWQDKMITWGQFKERLQKPVVKSHTAKEYQAMPGNRRTEVKDVGGFVGGSLKEGVRQTGHVALRTLITFDLDDLGPQFFPNLNLLFNYEWALYSTHSHTPEKPRYRVIFPLQRAVREKEYEPVSRMLACLIDIESVDKSSYDPVQLMFWPSIPGDIDYVFDSAAGELVDPDYLLQQYAAKGLDWEDTHHWPRSEKEKAVVRRKLDKAPDPTGKAGVVGAFCRSYDLHQAIEAFLPGVYVPCGDDRYTYAAGSAAGGLVLYDGGVFAYSHHSSDPISGKLCNAFDLVRLHKFAELDETAKEGTPVNKLPSYLAMQELAEKDEAVQKTLDAARLAAMEKEFGGEAIDPLEMFFIRKRFIPMYLARWFLQQYEAIVLQDELYLYQGGCYLKGERIFRERATAVLKAEFQTHRLNETLHYIKNSVQEIQPDAAVDTGRYLNVRNGLLDLECFELLPHSPGFKTVLQLPVDYDPGAGCPAIDAFLEYVLGPDDVKVIEEMAGYCLLPSMKHETAFMLYGDGSNGKGTLIAIIAAMLGLNNVAAVPLQHLTENRFLSAELFGKLANLNADIPEKLIDDPSLFKALVSGDMVQAERKHKEPFHFRNRAKLIFSANELPQSRDNSEGFHRRVTVIPFNRKFTDRALRGRLFQEQELQGFLNRAIRGLKRLEAQDGFTSTLGIDAAGRFYREKSDSAFHFINVFLTFEPGACVGKQELYDQYKEKCRSWGNYAMSQIKFNQRLKSVYPDITEKREGNVRQWKGIQTSYTSDDFV